MTDLIPERIIKLVEAAIRTIGQISRMQRIQDNDAEYVDTPDMLAELTEDNQLLSAHLREVHGLADECGDIASASLMENWIDETERRVWFLFESGRVTPRGSHSITYNAKRVSSAIVSERVV